MKLKLNQLKPDQRVREQTETLEEIRKVPEKWEALMSLAHNIKNGKLFYPILVRHDAEDYIVLDGHRRWLAIQWLHQQGEWPDEIEVRVINIGGGLETTIAQMSLDIQKEEFNIFEKARGIMAIARDIYSNGGVIDGQYIPPQTHYDKIYPIIATALGIGMGRFDQITNVLKVVPEAREVLERNNVPESRVKYVVSLKKPAQQIELAQEIVEKAPSNSTLRAKAQSFRDEEAGDVQIPKPSAILAEIKGITDLAKRFAEAKNIEYQLLRKDPRTIDSYAKAIPQIEQAIKDLQFIKDSLSYVNVLSVDK